MGKRLFNPWGGAIITNMPGADAPSVYCTMLARSSKDSSVADAFPALLTFKAPVFGLRITSGVDYSIAKGLDGDFLISTFGYKLTSIQFNGLNVNSICAERANSGGIYTYYRRWNVHADKTARVDVVIDGKRAYRCVLTSLDLALPGVENVPATTRYTLDLLGVQL